MLTNTRHRTVEWGDCDPAGIVFNPRCFEWFDAASAALFSRALGMTKAEVRAQAGKRERPRMMLSAVTG